MRTEGDGMNKYPNFVTARRRTVNEVEVREGEGIPGDPVRIVTYYADDEGNTLAVRDTWADGEAAQRLATLLDHCFERPAPHAMCLPECRHIIVPEKDVDEIAELVRRLRGKA